VTISESASSLLEALEGLRERVARVHYPLETPGAEAARRTQVQLVAQLDDYVLPRLRTVDAPLLAVVGGSTGAGKSTLVNSLVGRVVSATGVLRPTTRAPVLVHHPDDTRWFTDTRILPGLPRATGATGDPGVLHLVADPAIGAGVAILDAPDIDSVVDANRLLARELLAACDLWIFVTSAARYADEVPWSLLREAASRNATVAVVLDRIAPEAIDEITTHLKEMLDAKGLGDAPLFIIPESILQDELLPEQALQPLRDWLSELARDADARRAVVRRTLDGAVGGLMRRLPVLAEAAADQAATAERLQLLVDGAYDLAVDKIEAATADGTMLRGEVLARWQDYVGTGEFFRTLEATVGRLRDRVVAALRGSPAPPDQVGEAIGEGIEAVVLDEADRAAERAEAAWHAEPAGAALLAVAGADLSRSSPGLRERTAAEVRAWQGAVLDLVRTEGPQRRGTARAIALGVNSLAVALMLAVFASTAFIPTGAELVVGGGTAAVGQKILEAVFGDQAARRLAEMARTDLHARLRRLIDGERQRFLMLLEEAGVDPQAKRALDAAWSVVEGAR
jgi:energy-coupling factor transporter ATP-binding protein EcfA2